MATARIEWVSIDDGSLTIREVFLAAPYTVTTAQDSAIAPAKAELALVSVSAGSIYARIKDYDDAAASATNAKLVTTSMPYIAFRVLPGQTISMIEV